ncbi:NADP-dependent oxidoreductase [Paeniglutamicibacter psychrophenolicus]|uniref:NADP-dependent oxidoreductase n=1 Tax=Paeniglutamicibacter psychrophenolicus TaxID=257454 RepID=UPI00278A3E0E|nr:NADP-dependent oxidoreductase [Paeniglutamicibacter psychrophenolicus]MDQ0093748.1 NADPH:quinone reductase-like Zn-dependent oxidoreductase [Paeniglutamicibacter psychrophenolicus]
MGERTMKAMAYASYGGVEKLEQLELPLPKVGPGTVRIKIKAAGVNPVDWKIMAGYLDPIMDVHFPAVPGWDVAGVVDAVGFDTPEFNIGDEVHAYGRRDTVGIGSFAQYITLPAGAVAHKPKQLSFEEAAALPLTGGTALRALDALELAPGQTLLIHNGAGGVGQAAIQIGRAAGARVLATASERNHELLASLGAEPLTYGEGLVESVRALAPGGVDAVADFHGGALEDTLAVLKESGKHASIADGTVGEHGGRYIWVRPDGRELARIDELVEAGKLSVHVVSSYPMQEAAAAITQSMGGHAGGKIVLTEFTD